MESNTPTYIFYVLRCSDRSFYSGITTNVERRLYEHNHTSKGAKYTRSRRPVEIVYTESIGTRSQASQFEYYFKKKTHKQKEAYISENSSDDR